MLGGLANTVIERIQATLKQFPRIRKATLFGSRALGTHKPGSDIDLSIEGSQIDLNDILSIRVKLDELMLPYTFDIINYERIKEENLGDHIRRVGLVIYENSSS